ncbi:mechanosensitive ion channel family protein [Pontibacter sp. XAAS-A31]|nr:mechanosensitive ion channel family protein [Pontibacter harenae]
MNYIISNIQSSRWSLDQLIKLGVPAPAAEYINMLGLLLLMLILVFIADRITKRILVGTLQKLSDKTATEFDNLLIRNNAVVYLAQAIPQIIAVRAIPVVFSDFQQWVEPLIRVADIYMVVLAVAIMRAVLRSCRDYLKTTETFRDKPVESFVQVITIFLYFVGGLLIFSLLTGKPFWAFITAMGAASAVLLLIFKDTILGFVASIQVSSNDMVRIGDWITMEKYGADGDVTEINLTTVKVQNFDKTITTIPTYHLISDSFKNWRGMQRSGGRRIKRSVFIKISSIRYLSADDAERLGNIQLLQYYLKERQNEINQHNQANGIDKSLLINGRSLTNAGVFRRYIDAYLRQHPSTHKGMVMMVRQLEPTTTGMPIELYLFANSIIWVEYEQIMADIFDHLLAAVKYFDLEVFEMPAADDVRNWNNPLAGAKTSVYPLAEPMPN